MIVYVSMRPIPIRTKLLTPNEMLRYSFNDIPLSSWRCLIAGAVNRDDGRWLYEFDIASVDDRDVIIQSTAAWGSTRVLEVEAVALANKLTGRSDIYWDTDHLVIPVIDPPV
jgi:hypothetical protein